MGSSKLGQNQVDCKLQLLTKLKNVKKEEILLEDEK
jgi:hypothetical protein